MTAEDYLFHVMHHLGGRKIDVNNRLTVEFTCILKAGTIVTDKHTIGGKEVELHFEEEYVNIIRVLRKKTSKTKPFSPL